MPLPKAKTPAKKSVNDLSVLLFGPSKIGKSTFCAGAENAYFIATEPGLNHLEVYQDNITTWEQFLAKCKEISTEKHNFNPIVVDTVDNMYKMCSEYICKKMDINHESELGFGKGFTMVNNEFQRVLTRLASLPYGLFLISHSQEKEVDTRTGKVKKVVPTLPESARKIVLALVDIILYCDMVMEKDENGKPSFRRVVHTKPSAVYEAGDRTRRLPELMDLDYKTFVNYFSESA